MLQSELSGEGFREDFTYDEESQETNEQFADPIRVEVCAIVGVIRADGKQYAGTHDFRQQIRPENSILPPASAQEHRHTDRYFEQSGKNPDNILQGPMHEVVPPYIGPSTKSKTRLSDHALGLIGRTQRNRIATIRERSS